jgi:hypothetical protein
MINGVRINGVRINGVRVNIQYCIFTLTPFIFPFISIAYFSNSSFSF